MDILIGISGQFNKTFHFLYCKGQASIILVLVTYETSFLYSHSYDPGVVTYKNFNCSTFALWMHFRLEI